MRRQSIVWLAAIAIAMACHQDKVDGPAGGTLTIVRDNVTGTSIGDTLVVGDYVTFSLMGPDSSVPTGDSAEWSVSNQFIIEIVYQNALSIGLRAVRPGRSTLTVNYQGESGTHELAVRAVRASDTAVAEVQPMLVGTVTESLGDTIMIAFAVWDARRNIVWGRPSAFSLSDSTILQQDFWDQQDLWYNEHTMIYRAVKAGTTVVTLTCEGVQGSVKVVVQ
jgi:hypothetical protein